MGKNASMILGANALMTLRDNVPMILRTNAPMILAILFIFGGVIHHQRIYYLARGVIIWHQRESLFDKESYYIVGKNKTEESLFSA